MRKARSFCLFLDDVKKKYASTRRTSFLSSNNNHRTQSHQIDKPISDHSTILSQATQRINDPDPKSTSFSFRSLNHAIIKETRVSSSDLNKKRSHFPDLQKQRQLQARKETYNRQISGLPNWWAIRFPLDESVKAFTPLFIVPSLNLWARGPLVFCGKSLSSPPCVSGEKGRGLSTDFEPN